MISRNSSRAAPQQALGWDRRAAHRGVQPVELPGPVAQNLVDQRPNRAERMIGRNPLLGADT